MTDRSAPDVPEVRDTDVFITRMFAAPRDVVWRFFTEPDLLAGWFGPAEVHVDPTTVHLDIREGGRWDLDMVDNATGEHYPMRAALTVVIPPEYLEGRASADAQDGPVTDVRLRIWLHDHGDRTRLTLHQGPLAPDFRDQTQAGWLASFEKIDSMLTEGV